MFRSKLFKNSVYIPLTLNIGFSFILLYSFITNTYLLVSLLLRRILFVPQMLTFSYFQFFNMNQFVWWSSNKLISLFIKYPYEKPFPLLIGEDYLNTPY